jgi:3-hydroxyisobutyrate dehydrogenase
MVSNPTVGFVGLGNMGRPLAANVAGAGLDLIAYDAAGPEGRVPAGARAARSLSEVGETTDVVVLSLPDGDVVRAVVAELVELAHVPEVVLDTSTIGPFAAREAAAALAVRGSQYCDAPVSGGVAGAEARTIAVLFSGPDAAYEQARAVLKGLSDRLVRVGNEPGMGQVVKLANNFLSASALAAASEAVRFAGQMGVPMDVLLEAVNAASGRSQATADKFVHHVLTGRYASGFASGLMDKDMTLYRSAVAECGAPSEVADVTAEIWHGFAAAAPGADFTRIYQYISGELKA